MSWLPILSWTALALGVVALPICGYLGVLTLLSWPKRPPVAQTEKRIIAVVPAHNEELSIARTVQSLLACAGTPRVLVVADNCHDDTAAVATAAGAEVLVRAHATDRGKGYALEAGFAHLLATTDADGFVVVDADSDVAPNLFTAVGARMAAGAGAVQVVGGVRNREDHWRPRLLAIALAAINGVRSMARERLGLSVGLRGNGWAIARAVVEKYPHKVYSLVEDVEYGIVLGRAGIRVAYAHETNVMSELPTSASASVSQRKRWEGGRKELVRRTAWPLLREGIRTRSALLTDLALDLLVPPLSTPALLVAAASGLAVVHAWFAPAVSATDAVAYAVVGVDAACLLAYVLRAVSLSGTGWSGLFTLVFAPFYVAWKILVARPKAQAGAWVRTERIAESSGAAPPAPPPPSPHRGAASGVDP